MSTLALAPDATARHEQLLPAETVYAARVTDVPGLQKRFAQHPLAADLQNAKFPAALDAVIKNYQKTWADIIRKSAGASTGKIWIDSDSLQKFSATLERKLSGEILYAKINVSKPDEGHFPFDFILTADTTADETIIADLITDSGYIVEMESRYPQAYLDYHQDRANGKNPSIPQISADSPTLPFFVKDIISSFQGVTLHERESFINADTKVGNLGGWALVNKTFLYASSHSVLCGLVDAMQNGRKNNFSETSVWHRAAGDAGKSDFLLVVNAPLLNAESRQYYIAEKEKEKLSKEEANRRYDIFGLDAITDFRVSAELTKDEVFVKYALAFSEKRGALAVLQYKALETLVPSFIPAGVGEIKTERIIPSNAMKAYEDLIVSIEGINRIEDFIRELKTKEGIDLRAAVIENLGENSITFNDSRIPLVETDAISVGPMKLYVEIPPSSLGVGFAIGEKSGAGVNVYEVHDANKLASLIDTFAGKFGGAETIFTERNFMGVKIRTLKFSIMEQTPQFRFSYALLDGHFLLGTHLSDESPVLLEKTITELKKPQSSAASDPVIQRILKRVPKDAHSFSYNNLGKSLEVLFDLGYGQAEELATWSNANVEEEKPDNSPAAEGTAEGSVPVKKRPALGELPWVSFMHIREKNNELLWEAVLLRKEEK